MVYVLDKRKKPLMPCSLKRARQLLDRGRARVHKRYPFTIRLVDRFQEDSVLQPLTLKIDPGSKTTGMTLVREAGPKAEPKAEVVSLIELEPRGEKINKKLKQRAAFRRRRRSANLRYRAPRFNNRRRKKGWLPPSIQHRVDSTLSIVTKLRSLAPVTATAQELVRFDTELIENPEISGVEYQQGTLAGYEVREYLFEKWGRTCVYCDAVNVPLNLDHVIPRSKGGSDRASNLVPACIPCNQNKGAEDMKDFLARDKSRLERILKQAKQPLKDAAAVNATRWALYGALQLLGLPLSVGTGGRTKFNRHRFFIPKTHALDALCVGNMDTVVQIAGSKQSTFDITAHGRGAYQRTRLTKKGFPRGYLMRTKSVHGFQTGDQAKAVVAKGKKQGTYLGRVAVRETGSLNLKTSTATVEGINHNHCRLIQRGDGYGYHLVSHFQHFIGKERASSPA
jgi:5-methylcytosine-specific restriction endonuclease McrA